jgi:hypothetical protein
VFALLRLRILSFLLQRLRFVFLRRLIRTKYRLNPGRAKTVYFTFFWLSFGITTPRFSLGHYLAHPS